jgi:hypothetical protein
MVVELGSCKWFIAKGWRSFGIIATQDSFDLTATYYGICILDRLVLISINHKSDLSWDKVLVSVQGPWKILNERIDAGGGYLQTGQTGISLKSYRSFNTRSQRANGRRAPPEIDVDIIVWHLCINSDIHSHCFVQYPGRPHFMYFTSMRFAPVQSYHKWPPTIFCSIFSCFSF